MREARSFLISPRNCFLNSLIKSEGNDTLQFYRFIRSVNIWNIIESHKEKPMGDNDRPLGALNWWPFAGERKSTRDHLLSTAKQCLDAREKYIEKVGNADGK